MANIWSPRNNEIGNRGTRVDIRLVTTTKDNPEGWKSLGYQGFQYRIIQTGDYGDVQYKTADGEIFSQLQEFADFGYSGIDATYINRLKSKIQGQLIILTEEKIPQQGTQPAPRSASEPGAGPNSPDSTSANDPAPSSPSETDSRLTVSSEIFNTDNNYDDAFLKYPENMSNSQDRIVIVQKKYKSRIGTEIKDIKDLPITYNFLASEKNKPTQEILGTVILPMPNNISETNMTDWGEDSLSTLAALATQAGVGVAGRLSEFNVMGAFETLGELGSGLTKDGAKEAILQMLTLNAGASIVQKLGINVNPEAFRSRLTGTAINNNLELLFKGVKLRSFGFEFKMTPRSDVEARNIRYIIKFFKKGMAAKRNAGQPFFLGAPNVFDIHFKSGDNDLKSIGKIKTCALQQCIVNYTPEGFYAAFNDQKANGSQPISVTIQLAFTELYPIYNDDYDSGDIDSVGWDDNDFKYNEVSDDDKRNRRRSSNRIPTVVGDSINVNRTVYTLQSNGKFKASTGEEITEAELKRKLGV